MTISDRTALDAWLEKYEQLIRVKPTDEATQAHHRQQIDLLDRELAPEAAACSAAAVRAKATLARMRRRFPAAIGFWQDYARLAPDKAEFAALNIADIHMLNGEIEQADAVLATVSQTDHPLFGKVRQTLSDMERHLESSARYGAALEHFAQGRPEAFEQEVHAALKLLYGDAFAAHPQIAALVAELAKTPGADAAEIPMPEHGDGREPVAIFAAGFGWSGSGAAFDFLRQHQDAEPFSSEEIGIFASGEGDVVKCLDKLERRPEQFREVFCATVCHGILGLSARGDRGVAFVRKAKARALLSVFVGEEDKTNKLLRAAQRLVRKVLRIDLGDTDRVTAFSKAFAEFFQLVLKMKQGSRRYLIFSNAISGPYIEAMRLMPEDARAVAVVRDVRDAYADRFIAGKHWNAETFIRSYRKKRERYEKALAHPDVGRKVVQVRFEDLILDPTCRQELLAQLGMDQAHWADDGRHFDPGKSMRNIYIHPGFESQAAIALIADALPMYLHDRE